SDQRILHAIPQEYIVDNSQEGIRHPVGMSGVRLEVRAHLVVGALSAAQNISKCVNRCGLQVDDLILGSLGSSQAVLTADEKELGVALVDIGAGTTDIAVFVQGAIRHSASLPIAGDQVTNDIAHLLRTPTPHAEEIKVRYACALAQLATAEESIQVPSVGDRPPRRLARQALAEAVQNRYEEIFEMVQAELRRSGFEELVRAGLVLTGGAGRMEGVTELAEEMLHMPVRVGIPQYVTGLGEVVGNPVHATGVGLLLWGAQSESPRRQLAVPGRVGSFWSKLRNWYRGEFGARRASPPPPSGGGRGEGVRPRTNATQGPYPHPNPSPEGRGAWTTKHLISGPHCRNRATTIPGHNNKPGSKED